jgi:hypothetical protein
MKKRGKENKTRKRMFIAIVNEKLKRKSEIEF